MEEMSEDVIIRFFEGQCDAKEARAVLKYLEENKEAAERYTGKKEWDGIKLSDFFLSKERSQQMLDRVKFQTYERPISNIAAYRWAIAASMILAIATGLILFKTSVNNQNQIALIQKPNVWRSEKNTSDITRELILEDGTSVKLAPGSEISYQFPFPADGREVKLAGQGFFRVASEKSRPFSVQSGNLSTIALGTEFTIDAFGDKSTITVKLHEGRVMIKRMSGGEGFYLVPAQELTYNKATGRVGIAAFGNESSNSIERTKNFKTRQTGVIISFEREPLENVFDQLERAYGINLTYPEDGFNDYYFTGNFNNTDSLERVLRIIAQTNELEVIKTSSSYKIVKKR